MCACCVLDNICQSPGPRLSSDSDYPVKRKRLKLSVKLSEPEAHPILNPHTKFSDVAPASFCRSLRCFLSWRWQIAAGTWNKTWDSGFCAHTVPPLRAALLFVVLVANDHRHWKNNANILRNLWPLMWKFYAASFIFLHLYCSALLEQLSRLQALLPNSSSKTTHRGTCILVRYTNTLH